MGGSETSLVFLTGAGMSRPIVLADPGVPVSRVSGGASSACRFLGAVRAPLALLAASALTALASGVISAQTVEDSVAVGRFIDAYRTAWDTHDPSAVAAFFAEGADFVMGNQPGAVGRRAIEDWWSDYFSVQEPERHLTLDVHSVRFVATDVAVVNVTTTTGGQDPRSGELLARRFRGAWVVQRQGAGWLISAMRGVPTQQDRVVLNESPAAAEELRPEIRAFIDAYEDAFNSHDPAAVSKFYRNDADLIVRNGPVTQGRQAIEVWWTSHFAETRPYRAILIAKDIRMLTPTVALVNLVATGATAAVAPPGAPVRYARETWLLARGHEGWLIAALWVLPSEDDRIVRQSGR
jgi:uncharacterized protein (TIGR02246 family)